VWDPAPRAPRAIADAWDDIAREMCEEPEKTDEEDDSDFKPSSEEEDSRDDTKSKDGTPHDAPSEKRSEESTSSDHATSSSSGSGRSDTAGESTDGGSGTDEDVGPQDRGDALAVLELPAWTGGRRICYYRNGDFTAYCGDPNHGIDCNKSRTSHSGHRRSQGRPLGFLLAWIMQGDEHAARHDHVHFSRAPSKRSRKYARALLMTFYGADLIAELERPKRDDESDEPRGCP